LLKIESLLISLFVIFYLQKNVLSNFDLKYKKSQEHVLDADINAMQIKQPQKADMGKCKDLNLRVARSPM